MKDIALLRSNVVLHSLLLLITCGYLSCRKDVDRRVLGTYKGVARKKVEHVRNPSENTDTLYTDVLIIVSEGTESTRKETLLTLTFSPATITAPYTENMSIDNGVIDFTRTNKGAVGTYFRWKGTIKSDSLNLTNKNEEGNGSIWQWEFKAQKQ